MPLARSMLTIWALASCGSPPAARSEPEPSIAVAATADPDVDPPGILAPTPRKIARRPRARPPHPAAKPRDRARDLDRCELYCSCGSCDPWR